ELRENVLEVRGDGVRREIQLVRDLSVRPPLRGKLRDPVLGDGQAVPAADRPHACCGNTRTPMYAEFAQPRSHPRFVAWRARPLPCREARLQAVDAAIALVDLEELRGRVFEDRAHCEVPRTVTELFRRIREHAHVLIDQTTGMGCAS